MSSKSQSKGGQADYSRATLKEREQVVEILQRNVREMVRKKRSRDPAALTRIADELCARIRSGAVFKGKEFELLVRLFRKEPVA